MIKGRAVWGSTGCGALSEEGRPDRALGTRGARARGRGRDSTRASLVTGRFRTLIWPGVPARLRKAPLWPWVILPELQVRLWWPLRRSDSSFKAMGDASLSPPRVYLTSAE